MQLGGLEHKGEHVVVDHFATVWNLFVGSEGVDEWLDKIVLATGFCRVG